MKATKLNNLPILPIELQKKIFSIKRIEEKIDINKFIFNKYILNFFIKNVGKTFDIMIDEYAKELIGNIRNISNFYMSNLLLKSTKKTDELIYKITNHYYNIKYSNFIILQKD